jgi:hypothetical protein
MNLRGAAMMDRMDAPNCKSKGLAKVKIFSCSLYEKEWFASCKEPMRRCMVVSHLRIVADGGVLDLLRHSISGGNGNTRSRSHV